MKQKAYPENMKNDKDSELKKEIVQALNKCKLAVLSTSDGASPYASLIGFVNIDKDFSIIFATPSSGRKYKNLKTIPKAALLISEASGTDNNFYGASALTVTGKCEEIVNKEEIISDYIGKFPELESFARDAKTAFFRLKAESFYLVKNFQEVRELHIR